MTGYVFIVNPAAREGKVSKLWKKSDEYAKSIGLDYEVVFTEHINHAIDLAKDTGSKNDIRYSPGSRKWMYAFKYNHDLISSWKW